LKKEYLEIFTNGVSIVIDNFKDMKTYGNKISKLKLLQQDKGHFLEVVSFLKAVANGEPEPIPFYEAYISTLATFKTIQSLKTGKIQDI
jgi:hypothetical protein